MNNNIFKDAKFGDRFRTRAGKMAIYLFSTGCGAECITEEFPNHRHYYHWNGIPYAFEDSKYRGEDIIGKYDETNGEGQIEMFKQLPHLSRDYEVIDDWGYTPCLYHFDTQWFVSWVHCEDSDTLLEYMADSPEKVIMLACDNYKKDIAYYKKKYQKS